MSQTTSDLSLATTVFDVTSKVESYDESQEIKTDRDAVVSTLKSLNKTSLDLMWSLGKIYKEKHYVKWGFGSFAQWVNEDIANKKDKTKFLMSRSYAFQLAQAGRTFLAHKPLITNTIPQPGVRKLIELASMIEQGMSYNTALSVLLYDEELPEQWQKKGVKSDPEKPTVLHAFVKKGDADNYKLVLMLNAIAHKCSTLNESLNELVLGSLPTLTEFFDTDHLKTFHKFRDLIWTNRFYCKLCGNIPLEPTLHHVLPRSIGQGYGPQVLLCYDCHINTVQPNWEHYCEKWVGEGSVERLKKEVDQILEDVGFLSDAQSEGEIII